MHLFFLYFLITTAAVHRSESTRISEDERKALQHVRMRSSFSVDQTGKGHLMAEKDVHKTKTGTDFTPSEGVVNKTQDEGAPGTAATPRELAALDAQGAAHFVQVLDTTTHGSEDTGPKFGSVDTGLKFDQIASLDKRTDGSLTESHALVSGKELGAVHSEGSNLTESFAQMQQTTALGAPDLTESISHNGLQITIDGVVYVLHPGSKVIHTCCHAAKDKPTHLPGDLVLFIDGTIHGTEKNLDPIKKINMEATSCELSSEGGIGKPEYDIAVLGLMENPAWNNLYVNPKTPETYVVPSYNATSYPPGHRTQVGAEAWLGEFNGWTKDEPPKEKWKGMTGEQYDSIVKSVADYFEKETKRSEKDVYSDHVQVKRTYKNIVDVHTFNAMFPALWMNAGREDGLKKLDARTGTPNVKPMAFMSEEMMVRFFAADGNYQGDTIVKYVTDQLSSSGSKKNLIIGIQEMVNDAASGKDGKGVGFYFNALCKRLSEEVLPAFKVDIIGAAYSASGPEGSSIIVIGKPADLAVDYNLSPWLDRSQTGREARDWAVNSGKSALAFAVLKVGRAWSALVVNIKNEKVEVTLDDTPKGTSLSLHEANLKLDKKPPMGRYSLSLDDNNWFVKQNGKQIATGELQKGQWNELKIKTTGDPSEIIIHVRKDWLEPTLVMNVHAPNPASDRSFPDALMKTPNGKLDYRYKAKTHLEGFFQKLLDGTYARDDVGIDEHVRTVAADIKEAFEKCEGRLMVTGDFNDASQLYRKDGPLSDDNQVAMFDRIVA